MNDSAARESFSKAAEILKGKPRYTLPWAEHEMRMRHRLDEPNDFSDVIAKIPGSDPPSLSMRARLIAAEGRYSEALEIANASTGVEGWVAKAIIHMMQGHYNDVVTASNNGLDQPQIRDSSKQLFLILRARAKFALAMGDEFKGSQVTFPISGPIGANISLLQSAWLDIVAAVESLRSAGWPSNVEFIADVWSATASMLGRQRDALPFLTEAGQVRPSLPNLQAALESIAVLSDKGDIALEANERQPDSETKILKRVCLLHIAKRYRDCVDLFTAVEHTASNSNPTLGPTLLLAILSADRVVRPELARKWEERLDAIPELAPQRALLDYIRESSRNLLAKDVALSRLEERYRALGCPLQIAMQLFDRLDATDPEQANKCIELATVLQGEAMLPAEGALHLAHALLTRGKWQDLLDLSEDALRRFERNDRFLALKAFALDKLGQSSEALATVRDMIDAGRGDSIALSTYINIVVRSGFTAEAIKTVERVLSGETAKPRRIECLKMLFNLTQISDPASQRCVDIAWRIGQLADQEVEEEEGIFLMMACTTTLSTTVQLEEERQQEFQRRSIEFTRRFPDSKVFRMLNFPSDLSPEEFMRTIQQAIGPNEEQRKLREKLRNQLERGQIAVPYAWRPRSFLAGVHDLPTLWEVGKQARSDQPQYHLVIALSDWQPIPLSKIQGHVPLLDMISLFVIHDLELFNVIFRLFPKIAIGQATLIELQHFLSPIYGSPLRQKCMEIKLELKNHFEQIIQPTADLHENENVLADQASEEVKLLAREGRFMVYSDDVFFRSYCELPTGAPPSICTLDVLSALEEMGELSPSEVASKIAMLCKWNVGVVVLGRYMKAILPNELATARSVRDGIETLQASQLCYALFSGIWNPWKTYGELQGQAGRLLRDLCEEPNNRIESVAALMGLWFSKAKLHEKSPQPPLRCIALLIIQAAVVEDPPSSETSHRLWSVLLSLVEIEYGDRMDVAKEREAIALTGRIAAECDKEISLEGDKSLQQRLAAGLTNETAESDAFSTGYTQFHLKKVKKP
jgi:tetratricopeptide (TPR) repeat protein